MTYTLQKTIEKIRKRIGYDISVAAIYNHKRVGNLVPAKIVYNTSRKQDEPRYDDISISNFVEYYKTLVATGKTLQWKSKKHTA